MMTDMHMTPEAVCEYVAATSDGIELARTLLPALAAPYRRHLTARFVDEYGRSVQGGIFAGMQLTDATAWFDGDQLAKLLGAYEAELHAAFELAFRRGHTVVINVGCAEGYYAVGAALRQPSAHVYAFDIDPRAVEVCAAAAALNGTSDRVTVSDRCGVEDIAAVVVPGTKALVVMDCEGGELALLTPELSSRLASCDLIVECHDFRTCGTTARLREHFASTHAVQLIHEGDRPPLAHPFLDRLSGLERAVALCECRPEPMTWLFCASREMPLSGAGA